MKLVVAVTGTPGTGKKTFARALAPKINASVIELNRLIEEAGAFRLDSEGTKVANPTKMRKVIAEEIAKRGNVIVEGHLSHLLPTRLLTHVVVLRTHPKILEKRLRKKGQSGHKLEENLEAEALDIILWEAVKAHGMKKVYEIDTTRRTPPAAVKLFLEAMAGKISLTPGKVSWLENFLELYGGKKFGSSHTRKFL